MGQVIIEVPQEVNRVYQIDDVEKVAKLLRDLEEFEQKRTVTPAVIPPRRNSLKEDGDAVLGIWADREESGQETKKLGLEILQLNLPEYLDDVDGEEAVGIWADREESAQEIARNIRDRNNGKI